MDRKVGEVTLIFAAMFFPSLISCRIFREAFSPITFHFVLCDGPHRHHGSCSFCSRAFRDADRHHRAGGNSTSTRCTTCRRRLPRASRSAIRCIRRSPKSSSRCRSIRLAIGRTIRAFCFDQLQMKPVTMKIRLPRAAGGSTTKNPYFDAVLVSMLTT